MKSLKKPLSNKKSQKPIMESSHNNKSDTKQEIINHSQL